ncbi:MAG: hypothetical protein AAF718_10850 [Pseudomonadota bacterium]
MSFLKKTLSTALITLLPCAALAKPVTMQCVVDNSKSKGWIAEQIFVEYDTATKAARVVDGIVLHYNKRKPAAAQVSENTDKKMVVKWDVFTKVGRQTAKMGYRVALLKPSNKVLVTAKPHGFADNLTARGRCQTINQKLPMG